MKKKNCKKCGQELIYITKKPTFTQLQPKEIAIESSPNEKGNIVIEGSYYRKISDADLGKAQQLKLSLYRIHDENCNKSKRWGKK